jgi:transposase, IS5 family
MVDRSPGFFDLDDRLAELSVKGDGLERVRALIDFEMFRPALEAAVPRADRSKGGRPAFDHVVMFKVLILQAMHALSDERTEFLIKDRLSFMRFLGLRLADAVPDANTIWTFREALKKADAIDGLFRRFDEALRSEGFLAMSGQIVDATIVATPKQRNTLEEKKAIKEGQIPADWKDKPAKLAQKDLDARWTVKYSKAKPREDGSVPAVDLAIPAFGYKNHVSIDRGFGLIRKWTTTHTTGRGSKTFWTGRTRPATFGLTQPTGQRRTKRCSRDAGSCRASIARSRRAGRCLSACVSPTRRNQKFVARSSTCSRIRKDRWASSCARSA